MWRHFGNKSLIKTDIIEYVKNQININPNVQISVGTDSSFKGGTARYETVIAFRNIGKGATGVYLQTEETLHYTIPEKKAKQKNRKFSDQWVVEARLRREQELTVEVVNMLQQNNISVGVVEVDYNTNSKFLSNRVLESGVNQIIANGFYGKITTKNDVQISTVMADKLC